MSTHITVWKKSYITQTQLEQHDTELSTKTNLAIFRVFLHVLGVIGSVQMSCHINVYLREKNVESRIDGTNNSSRLVCYHQRRSNTT